MWPGVRKCLGAQGYTGPVAQLNSCAPVFQPPFNHFGELCQVTLSSTTVLRVLKSDRWLATHHSAQSPLPSTLPINSHDPMCSQPIYSSPWEPLSAHGYLAPQCSRPYSQIAMLAASQPSLFKCPCVPPTHLIITLGSFCQLMHHSVQGLEVSYLSWRPVTQRKSYAPLYFQLCAPNPFIHHHGKLCQLVAVQHHSVQGLEVRQP